MGGLHYTETRWLHALFGASSVAIVVLVGVSIAAEWQRPALLEQRIVPALGVVDRCESCHSPDRHPGQWLDDHPVERFGCTPCHGGQGLATAKRDAHEASLGWERPLFTRAEREAACGTCHQGVPVPGAPVLTRGRIALQERGCTGCHDVPGLPRPNLAPDLNGLNDQVTPGWLRAWLTDPTTYDAHARMPKFALSAVQIEALAAFLLSRPGPTVREIPAGLAGDSDRGRSAVGNRRCATCHTLERPAGTLGPTLALAGAKLKPAWLFSYLTDTHRIRPDSRMPGFRLPDAEAADVVAYMTEQLVPDTEILPWAAHERPVDPQLVPQGRKLFVALGCRGCHAVKDVPLQNSSVALGNFGDRRAEDMPRPSFVDLVPDTPTWVARKLTHPQAFDLTGQRPSQMPSYRMDLPESLAIGVALASLKAQPPPAAWVRNASAATMPVPQGETGRLIDRFRCLVCHRVGAQGGDVSRVALDGEGSRVQRPWLDKFLREPTTVRMNQPERMPVLGMTQAEAALLAAWVDAALGDDRLPPAPEFQPTDAMTGKVLYDQYKCAACHDPAAMKAPLLDAAGLRLELGYVFALLRQGPAVVPGRRHPNVVYAEADARAMTAYVMSLVPASAPEAPQTRQGAARP
ncbi:MAG: c-type cytochrome [Myxococcota bacterium]